MEKFLLVGLGGAAGAMLRYLISLLPYKGGFPLLTLATNLLGAVLIGVIVGFAAGGRASEGWLLFLKTGLCGGFTTFSTFSLEAFSLFDGGHRLMGLAYVLCSVTACLLGVWLGERLGKAMA